MIASQGSNHLFQNRKEDICLFSQLLCTLKGSSRTVILMLGKRMKEFLEGFSSNLFAFWGQQSFLDKLLHECCVYANCKVYIF